jgi:NADPH:quinone reductase-like Zn-dependent oxidoreductase
MTYRGIGPIPHLAATLAAGMIRRRPKLAFFVADINAEDLTLLAGLMENGDVKPVIDRRYELSQMVDALTYFGEGHARGKVVVSV